MKKGVVLLSGGLDSLVLLSLALKECQEICVLHINYGQNTEVKELEAFHNICDHYSLKERFIINIDYLKQFGSSSLFGEKNTSNFVPFRNGNILSIATSLAEARGFNSIYMGSIKDDYSDFPDCRESFFKEFEEVINLGTKNSLLLKLETPLVNLSKEDVIKLGITLNAPFELSWSCYKNNDTPCNVCDSCKSRKGGFDKNKLKDLIVC